MSDMERLAFTVGRNTGERGGAPDRPDDSSAIEAIAPAEPEGDRFAYRALLAFMFVLLVRPQDQLPFLEPLHLAELCGFFAFGAMALGRLQRGLPVTRVTPEVGGVLAFAALMAGTIPLSFWPGGSFQLFSQQFIKIVIIFLVMATTLTTRRRIEQFVTLVVLGATYVATRAAVDYVRGANLVEGGRIAGAVGGLFGNPNDMALNMVAFLPLSVGLALDTGRPRARLLGLLGVPTMVAAIIFSQSRGGTLGFVAMALVLLVYMRRLKPAVAVALVVAGFAALPVLPSSFTNRMASIVNPDEDPTGSREARKTLLREGWTVFLANPIIGIGAGQFTNYSPNSRQEAWRQTHNAPLQVASELGIVGVGIFGFLIWSGFSAGFLAVRRARAERRRRTPAPRQRGKKPIVFTDAEWVELSGAMVVASMVGWFVAALFASVAYYWTLYLVLGIAGAIRHAALRLDGAAQSRAAATAKAA